MAVGVFLPAAPDITEALKRPDSMQATSNHEEKQSGTSFTASFTAKETAVAMGFFTRFSDTPLKRPRTPSVLNTCASAAATFFCPIDVASPNAFIREEQRLKGCVPANGTACGHLPVLAGT